MRNTQACTATMVVRLKKSRRSDDTACNVFVPEGMTGRVNCLDGDCLSIYWDYAFVCNVDNPSDDAKRGPTTDWWEEGVPHEDVELVTMRGG